MHCILCSSDVNDSELFDAEPIFSFSEEKNEPEPNRDYRQMSTSRAETLTKRN